MVTCGYPCKYPWKIKWLSIEELVPEKGIIAKLNTMYGKKGDNSSLEWSDSDSEEDREKDDVDVAILSD